MAKPAEMGTTGTLIDIAIASAHRAPMQRVAHASVSRASGIEGDVRGVVKDRQVTIVFKDGWDAACRDLGEEVPWTLRRANLFVDGISAPQEWGARLRIGSVLLMVTEETTPCIIMERQHAGLKAALTPDWRGGVCCKVLEGGVISVGEKVEIVAE